MVSSREAGFGSVTLALGLLSLGCYSFSAGQPRMTEAEGNYVGVKGLPPTIKADMPLQIAEPPATRPSRNEDTLLVSAAPAPPAAPQPDPPPSSSPPSPSSNRSPAESLKELARLHKQAAEQYAKMDSYIARLRRREQVNGKDHPEEILRFKFRKDPWSVSLKWLGTEGKGREVVFVKGKYENKLHTLLAAGDMPLMPAGKRIALPVDSVLVKSASRHDITDAGIGSLIDHFGAAVELASRGDPKRSSLIYLGPQTRREFATPHEAAEQLIPSGTESTLSRGGRRLWYFDPENHLPVLVVTYDDTKKEVEYYLYDRFQFPVKLDDYDFDPEKMGGERP